MAAGERKGDWRVRAYPVQVRIYTDSDYALYSRHRDWGDAARRAYVEAQNAYPGRRVELVDTREVSPDRHGEWATCDRCGYNAQISRSVAYGGFLSVGRDGLILCWNGRECSLRVRRQKAKTT